jgi:hypothetical protein
MEPHAVPTREEKAEAVRDALSLGAWHRHRGGAAAMTAISRHSRATRGDVMGSSQRLGRSTLARGEEQRKGMGLER